MNQTWREIALRSEATIHEALQVLNQGGMQIALVVDDDCHLVGTVTDGDIRRALLKGHALDAAIAPVMNPNPITGLEEEDPASWQRTMLRHALRHLPVLDTRGCVVGLVRYQSPSEPVRNTPVIIMAGGLGSRLRPLTEHTPKPLIPIGSKPVLETIIENFVDQGFRRIHLCINYKGEMIREHFGDGEHLGAEISYIEENTRLGTAGALSLLPEVPREPAIVMNGDLLTKVDFVRLLDFHKKQGFVATMATRDYHHHIPYGVLELAQGYRVKRLIEKPTERYQVSAGIYILDPKVFRRVPDQQFYDMPTLFDRLIDDGHPVGSFPLRDYWIDIGRLEDLERASAEFAEMFG